MTAFLTILAALAMTELTESLIIMIWENERKTLLAVLLANIVTNPASNGIMMAVRHFSGSLAIYISVLVFVELLTIAVESQIIMKMTGATVKKAYTIGAVINLCSFLFGIALMFV